MQDLDDALDNLIDVIVETEEYKRYKSCLKELKKWPELLDRTNEFRMENFKVQCMTDDRHLIDAVENFEERYEGFRSDERVNNFLRSELAFNRLMQEVYARMIEGIEYE